MRRTPVLHVARMMGLAASAVLVLSVCQPALANYQFGPPVQAQGPLLYSFGWNWFGQLGVGSSSLCLPVQSRHYGNWAATVAAISADEDHSLMLLKTPRPFSGPKYDLYGFGDNWCGVLGLGDTAPRYTPTRIRIPFAVTDPEVQEVLLVSAGQDFTLVSVKDSSGVNMLYAFGRNDVGQTGVAGSSSWLTPQVVTFFTGKNVKAISAGGGFSLVLVEDPPGSFYLYGFGANDQGQLGLGAISAPVYAPTLITGLWTPTGPDSIAAISAGGAHSLVLTRSHKVYAFGRNNEGQLGLGPGSLPTVATPTLIQSMPGLAFRGIDAGQKHSLFIYSDYACSCGLNARGQLGLGDQINRDSPTHIPGSDGVTAISAGRDHSLFLVGQVAYGCGCNCSTYRELGFATSNPDIYTTLTQLPVGLVSQIAAGWWHSLLVGT